MSALPPGGASPISSTTGTAAAAAFIGCKKSLPCFFSGSLRLNIWRAKRAALRWRKEQQPPSAPRQQHQHAPDIPTLPSKVASDTNQRHTDQAEQGNEKDSGDRLDGPHMWRLNYLRQSCWLAASKANQSLGGLPRFSIFWKTAYGSDLPPEERKVCSSFTQAKTITFTFES